LANQCLYILWTTFHSCFRRDKRNH